MAVTAPSPALVHTLVARAVHAPSSHNTQPWLFRPTDEGLAVFADRTRRLPVNDPHDRELTISVGCAVFTLRAAAAAEGCAARVATIEGPDDQLADVVLEDRAPSVALASLAHAIETRWTTREPFLEPDLPDGLVEALTEAAAAEGARLVPIAAGGDRERLAELVAEGDRRQFADRRWRRELASWMHARRAGDGLPTPGAPFARAAVRTLDLGARTASGDAELAREAPLVVALVTARDDVPTWLATGQALQRVLLVAARTGITAGYLNQPCQVEALRPELARLVGDGHPQIVLRLGTAPAPAARAPRRPVDEVILAP